ncbi:uncharacterized protein N0V96_008382 [Colletotrichum fioriniae]|uniref:uncharacterized protein n=1 Tax=Colletotrichum fioriniae TaxID=710243 RepID=UPI0032DAA162|nr:hypothetical protein N0V96_008382 [Colletotrichum fioriniae]
MAQKAKKDRAKSNATTLNNLHIGSAVVNVAFLIFYFIFKSRSLFWFILLSAPALICEYTSGEDLAAAGLTEYMFDVVWVTWASVVLVILFGNWGWFLWLAVPAYGAYAGYGLLGAGKRMAQMGAANSEEPAPPANRRQRRAA